MLGTGTVPHWFRRAMTLLNAEVSQQWRAQGGAAAARRAQARRRVAPPRSQGRGPKVLEEIVVSWEAQQRAKRNEAAISRRPRRTW